MKCLYRWPWRDPAYLDDTHRSMARCHHPYLLGSFGATFGRSARRGLLRERLEQIQSDLVSGSVCKSGSAFNCYWQMPFREHCRITIENIGVEQFTYYYQIDYTLTEVPEDAAYFCAQFRRTNPLPYKKPYTILDGVEGHGHYVGTYMAWGVNNNGWWGEARSSSIWMKMTNSPPSVVRGQKITSVVAITGKILQP